MGFLFVSMVSGCGSAAPPFSIRVTGGTATLAAGTTLQLAATKLVASGQDTDITTTVTWNSSNPLAVGVSSTGLITGIAAGESTITATDQGVSGSLMVITSPPAIESLAVSPPNARLSTGDTVIYSATANYANKTAGAVPFAQWSVLPASVAAISTSGVLTAVGPGTFSVTASAGGFYATVHGTVSAATLTSIAITPADANVASGARQQFLATGAYADGTTRDDSTIVAWTSSDPATFSIDANGLGTASTVANPAAVTLQATIGAVSGSTVAHVLPPAMIDHLYVEPTSSSIAMGTAELHTAIAFYKDGTQQDVSKSVVWSVSNTTSPVSNARSSRDAFAPRTKPNDTDPGANGTVSINQSGVDQALSPGTSSVQATLGGVQSQSVVIVTAATVTGLAIRASKDLFPVGAVQPVQLIGAFSDGTTQDLSLSANWTSSDPSIATIDSTGLATGLSAGAVIFGASFGGLSTSTVGYEVVPLDLVSTVIDIPFPIEPDGLSQQLRLLGTYANGTTQDLTQLATWSVADPDFYRIDSSGLGYALTAGSTQITGTVFGISAIARIDTFDSALNKIAILPNGGKLALGTTLDFASYAQVAAFNLNVDISIESVWTSSDPSVLTVNSRGRVKSGKTGTTTLSVTLEGITQFSSTIEVTGATLERMTVLPGRSQLGVFTPLQYTVYGVFSDGSVQDLSADVIWGTSDNTVASIDAAGLAIGMKPGNIQVTASFAGQTASAPLTVTNATIQSVAITPNNFELPAGFNEQLSLIATMSDGTTEDLTQEAIWTTPTLGDVGIALKGFATGVLPGVGTIAAQYGFFGASASITVTDATLASLALTPASSTIRVGDYVYLTMTGTFSDGLNLDVTLLNTEFASDTPSVAQTIGKRYAYAANIGNATITGVVHGMSASTTKFQVLSNVVSSIAITPATATIASRGTQQFVATATYADGSTGDVSAKIAWTSSMPSLLSIDAKGLATAGTATGVTDVTVMGKYKGATATAVATVQPPRAMLTSIAITPSTGTIASGTTQQFTATATYADGSTQNVSASTAWSSSNAAVLSINAQGLATAGVTTSPVNVAIRGADGGVAGTAILTVQPASMGPALIAIAVTPTGSQIAAGTAEQLTATGTYADGTTSVISSSVVWSSSNTTIVNVGATGYATGVAAGVASVQAASGAISTAVVVRVSTATVSSVAITPTNANFAAGTTQQFTLTGTFTDGTTQNLSQSATWSTSTPGVATISSAGLATGVAAGTVQLSASYNGQSDFVTATITPATLQSILVSPTSSHAAVGTTAQFTAKGTYSDGSSKDITSSVIWMSSSNGIATVGATGIATGIGVGLASIQAAVGGVSNAALLKVGTGVLTSVAISPSGTSFADGTMQQFTLTGTFSDGTTQNLSSSAVWSSSNPAVATISPMGLADGAGAGSVQFTATYGGLTGTTSTVTVTSATLVSVAITPSSPRFADGTAQQFTVTGTFSDGTTQDLTGQASFSSSNSAVLSVSDGGLAQGVIPGSAEISGTVDGITATTQSVTVTAATLVSIAVTPNSASIADGTSQQFTATGTFSDGSTQDLSSQAVWTSSNAQALTINAMGLADSVGVGSAQVTASLDGISFTTGSTTITAATLVSLTLSPASAQIAKGTTQQITATGHYTDDTNQNLTTSVTWSSSNGPVASISASGLATGNGVGSAILTASYQGRTVSTSSFQVTAATLVGITFSPAAPSVATGSSTQVTVTGTFSDGTTQNLSSSASYSSSNPAAFSVGPTGIITAIAPGTSTITVTVDGMSKSFIATATNAALVSLAITPNPPASIAKGATEQFTATGTFSDGSTQVLTSSVIWSSSNTAAVTVNSTGLATGANLGAATLTAAYQGKTAVTPSFQVTAAVISSIAVTPANPTITTAGSQQFTATATYTDGTTQNATNAVTWSSSDQVVAVISPTGLASALLSGSTTIQAQLGSVTGSATLTVTAVSTAPVVLNTITVSPTSSHAAAGTMAQFTAIGNYSDGSRADLTSSVTWSTSNLAEATITPTGLATAVSPGAVTIQAASGQVTGQVTGQATLVVSNATLVSVAISPSGASFADGAAQQFTLTGTFSDGTTQNLSSSATWSSSAPQTATVSSTGLVTGVAPGTVQFTAVYGGLTATTGTVTITPATLVSVAILPANPSFADRTSQQLRVIGTYSDGTTHDLTDEATFSSSNPAVVNVSPSGDATGVGVGSSQVSVTAGGMTTTVPVTITSATLVSIAITPSSPSFADDTTQQFTAIGTFSDGTTQDLSTQVVWTSSNPEVLTIDANGLAESTTVGSAQVTAALNGVSSSTGSVTVTPATLTNLTISPTTAQIAKGTTQQFTATGTYSDGTMQNLSSSVTWSSSDSSVASIGATGVATGNGVGSAVLTATYQGMTASTSSFLVTPATLVSIAFMPSAPSVAAGSTAQVTVTGTFSDGTTQNLSASAMYSSSNPAVATVSPGGVVAGVMPGTSTVTVTVDGMTSSFPVTVTTATLASISITPNPPSAIADGQSEQFTATGTYTDGTMQNITNSVVWSSSNTAVMTITNSGVATGQGLGTASLTASYQGQTATTIPFQVTAATVASILVTPVNPSINPSGNKQFAATATYTDGTTQDVSSTVTWSSSNMVVAMISPTGLATALLTGSTTIEAQLNSLANSTTLTVTTSVPVGPVTLTSIAVAPMNASVAAGSMLQYTATATYSDGSMQNVSSMATWTSANPGVAAISSTGLANAIAVGSTTIAAQLSGITNSTSLTVTALPVTLASIAVSPSTASIAKGSTQQFVATGTYTDGSMQNLSTQVAWQSSMPAIATINNIGLANGVNAGNTQISASYQGLSSMVNLTVSPASLVSLAVTPQTVSLASGTTQQYKAVGTLSDGGTQDLTTSVNWTSSNTGVASINAAGFATSHASGTTSITAQAGSVSAAASMTVTSASAISIQLSPAAISLAAGNTQQLVATAIFTDASSQNVTSSAVYTSSNPSVVTVSTTGNVIAVGPGTATITATLGSVSTMANVTINNAVLTSIAITPSSPSLPVGLSQQLTATGTFSNGSTQDLTNTVTWSSSAPSTASVSTTGNLVIAQAGTAVITATSGSVSGNVTATGTTAVVTAIAVSPASVTLAAGQTQQFAATATLSDGTQQTVTSSAHWSVANPADASVSNSSGSNGFVTSKAAGTTSVTATVNTVNGSASVTIQSATLQSISISPTPVTLPAGVNQALTVTGMYTDGSSADVTASASFTTGTATFAIVSASGVVHGVSAGATTLTATVQGVSATDAVVVTNGVLVSIALSAATTSAAVGQPDQMTAIGTYSDLSTSNITSQVQWSSSNSSVATVGSSGAISSVGVGTATFTATLNSVSQTYPFTVVSATLQSIAVTAIQNSFALGLSLQLKAEGTYSNGTMQDLTSTVTWSSQTPTVGVVSSTGLATGHTTGSFNAVATSGGVVGSLGLTVTGAVLQSITVTPANTVIVNVLGSTIQYTATGHFSDGTTANLTNSVHWAITAGLNLGTLSQMGVFSPLGVGLGTITATDGSISGSTGFRVVAI